MEKPERDCPDNQEGERVNESIEQYPILHKVGGDIIHYLQDHKVMEIMVNPNNTCFVERFGEGIVEVEPIPAQTTDAFLRVIADIVGEEWREESPRLHAAVPTLGIRIQANLPPITTAPMMCLRKHPLHIFPLTDFIEKGIVTQHEADIIMEAIAQRKTVIISGGTGTAKTSLINAILHALRETTLRFLILEDDPELRCEIRNSAMKHTVDETGGRKGVTMRQLVRDALRERPDWIVVGEVRDGSALDMLRAFQTGHPGIVSIHANTARTTPMRIEQLVKEVSVDPQRELIAEAIDLIVNMHRHGGKWRITEIVRVEGYTEEKGYALTTVTKAGK